MEINLKSFISQAIVDICDGITDAKMKLEEVNNNAVIAPSKINGIDQPTLYCIEFDILVNVNENTKSGSKASVNISVVSANLGSEKYNNINTQQRIKFSVPYVPQGLKKSNQK